MVRQVSVEHIIFAKDWFDVVTAFETAYFWLNLPQCFLDVYRVLKPGSTFFGCFYVKGEHKRTGWFIRHAYERAGFFTPPDETAFGLKTRLNGMYAGVDMGKLKSIVWFVCRKAETILCTKKQGGRQTDEGQRIAI